MELQDFPLDLDDIGIELLTGCLYRSLDGTTTMGEERHGKQYSVQMISRPGEGDFISAKWSGRIAEWTLHGVSCSIETLPPDQNGQEEIEVKLRYHVSRRASFYFWKALLPLYLLTVLSFSSFEFDVLDLSSRNDTTSTYFLAAFAMLYVVGEALPKTDFLTKVDKVRFGARSLFFEHMQTLFCVLS